MKMSVAKSMRSTNLLMSRIRKMDELMYILVIPAVREKYPFFFRAYLNRNDRNVKG